MKTVYVIYEDLDNSCGDPDCCGGPYPDPSVKIFSTLEKALAVGHKREKIIPVKIDTDDFTRIHGIF